MDIKFSYKDNKYSYKRKIKKYNIWDNPFGTIFPIIQKDFYNNIVSYYKGFNEELEKYINKNGPARENVVDNKDTLPANGHDICNYLARHRLANYQIQTIMKLDSRLDYNKLVRAVRLSMDIEPVFGCHFVEGDPPYWKRLDNLDETMFCSFEGTNDLEKAIGRFLESPLDMDKDPGVKVRLIRSDSHDTLCIKNNHTCCDGAGVKEYIKLLSEIYSMIDQGNDVSGLKPRIGGRKDQDRLFNALGLKNPKAGWNPLMMMPKTMWAFPWKQGKTNATRFVVCRLPYGYVDILSRYGKERGATINDLILTAYYRSMFEISRTSYGVPMDISCTIDLRRYLPDQKAEAIRNLSGGFITTIERIKDEPFEGTLARVKNVINKIKNQQPGLQNAIGGELVEKTNFSQINAYYKASSKVSEIAAQYSPLYGKLCIPGLSNLGIISKDLMKFGESVVTDAYIVPPAVRAPGFLLLACTYNGVLSLITGCYKAEISRKDTERLLNRIKDELMEGCK